MPPPAPARFSITTGCLSSSSIFLVRMRAITSLGPPGAKPRTNVIGLVGNSAAPAAGVATHSAANPAAQIARFMTSSRAKASGPALEPAPERYLAHRLERIESHRNRSRTGKTSEVELVAHR